MLGLLVNWLAAALLAFTIFFYVFVYTMWLKRRTPQNIVIGGAAGAFPPMIGWAAVDRRVAPREPRAVPRSSSCGRRRISGRWRCSSPATTRGPACRCCRSSPGRRDAPADPALLAGAGAARRAAVPHRALAARSTRVVSALRRCSLMLALRSARVREGASRATGRQAAVRLLDPLPLPLFAVLLVEQAVGLIGPWHRLRMRRSA